MKLFINIFLHSNPMCPTLQSAFSSLALLLHNLDTCSSKFSLLSTSRPNNVTFSEEVMTFSSIVSFWGLFFWFFLSIISSMVNEVIKKISNFFKKRKIINFPPLRSFCARKTVAFVVFCSLNFVLLVGFDLICVFVRLKFFR